MVTAAKRFFIQQSTGKGGGGGEACKRKRHRPAGIIPYPIEEKGLVPTTSKAEKKKDGEGGSCHLETEDRVVEYAPRMSILGKPKSA